MIPYMVGKPAPNSLHLARGLVNYVPGRDYFRAVSSQNGDNSVTSPPSSCGFGKVCLRRVEEGDQADIFNIIQKRPNTGVRLKVDNGVNYTTPQFCTTCTRPHCVIPRDYWRRRRHYALCSTWRLSRQPFSS